MRIFLYEQLCATGSSSTSLHAEGWAMLQAVAEDFSRVAGVYTLTALHELFGRDLGNSCTHVGAADEPDVFRRLAGEADFTLVIAPEFDDLLAERCRWVLEAGGRLLGSSVEAVVLAADKLALAGHLREAGIATPLTVSFPTDRRCWDDWLHRTTGEFFPAVCKPRYGAGSQATFLVPGSGQVPDVDSAQTWEFILQPFVPGQAASVAFLIGPGGIRHLAPAAQHLSTDGRFHYQGGELPLPPHLAERALRLARRAAAAVPGLQGYVGVDLVLGAAADGSKDQIIEVNPRLTTSYIGLRRLARGNLAAALLTLMAGQDIPPLEWHPGTVRFWPDGAVEHV